MLITRFAACTCLATLAFVAMPCFADPIDPAAARELLKQGYSLKKDGKYAEALARLVESLRLDSQVKTLVNIADCEEMMGNLTQAQKHWILARDQASLQGDQTLLIEAEKRLIAVEARMPRLTINVVGPKLDGLEVRRDNVLLGQVALGVPLPTDPAHHTVVVTAPGHEDARFEVELAEKENKVLDVQAGPALASAGGTKQAAASEPTVVDRALVQSGPAAAPSHGEGKFWNVQRIAAVGVAGLGVAGFGLAGWSWSKAKTQHDAAVGLCTPDCGSAAEGKQNDAVSSAKLSTAMVITGSVLVAGGVVLWLTAPSRNSSTAIGVSPGVSADSAGLLASGTF